MLSIDRLFRQQQYEEGRKQMLHTPKEVLCRSDETILHITASICDDGTATKIAVDQGYGVLLGTRTTRFNNQTPLHILIIRDNIHAFNQIKSLLKTVYFSEDVCDECVMMAVTYNRERMLPDLVEHLKMSKFGCAAAFQTATNKNRFLAAKLLFAKYQNDLSPLISSTLIQILRRKSTRTEMIQLIHFVVEQNPNLTQLRELGTRRTLLHIACAYTTPEAVALARVLATDAAALEIEDGNGDTPLRIAYRNRNVECMKVLLAVPNAPVLLQCSPRGMTFISYVINSDDVELWDALVTGNPQLKRDACVFVGALLHRNAKVFEHAIKNGTIEANAPGFHGRNLLMFAIFRTVSKERLDLIFDYGNIDIEAQDEYGNTALHYAATNKNHHAAERILALSKRSSYIRNCAQLIPADMVMNDDLLLLKLLTVDRFIHAHTVNHNIDAVKKRYPAFVRYIETPPSMLEFLLQIDSNRMKTLKH